MRATGNREGAATDAGRRRRRPRSEALPASAARQAATAGVTTKMAEAGDVLDDFQEGE